MEQGRDGPTGGLQEDGPEVLRWENRRRRLGPGPGKKQRQVTCLHLPLVAKVLACGSVGAGEAPSCKRGRSASVTLMPSQGETTVRLNQATQVRALAGARHMGYSVLSKCWVQTVLIVIQQLHGLRHATHLF